MQKEPSFWSDWAAFLRKWGLEEVTAALLDAAGPVNIILSQFLYMGHPLLHEFLPSDRLAAFERLLESPEESQTFAAYLREESNG